MVILMVILMESNGDLMGFNGTVWWFTLWYFFLHSDIEHGPFIVDLPIKDGDCP